MTNAVRVGAAPSASNTRCASVLCARTHLHQHAAVSGGPHGEPVSQRAYHAADAAVLSCRRAMLPNMSPGVTSSAARQCARWVSDANSACR